MGKAFQIKKSTLLFLLWPFASLVNAISHYKRPSSRNVVWLFGAFLGFTFVLSSTGIDAYRIAERLELLKNSDINFQTFSTLLYSEEGYADVFVPLTTYLVSLFSFDYRVLFLIFGLVFGYFYSRNIWFLIDRKEQRFNSFSILLILSFALSISFWDIGGRWFIAAQIFLFGAFNVLFKKNSSGFLITGLSFLFHWAFLIPNLILVLYKVLGNRPKIYFTFFVLSFFVDFFQLNELGNYFSNLAPDFIAGRSTYFHENYAEIRSLAETETAWYIKGHKLIIHVYLSITISYLFKKNQLAKIKPLFANNLLNFSLVFYGIINIFSVIPSFERFYALGNLVLIAFIFLFIQKNEYKIPPFLKVIGVPSLFFFIVVRIRYGFDFIGLPTIVGNPLTVIFFKNPAPLIEFIKQLF